MPAVDTVFGIKSNIAQFDTVEFEVADLAIGSIEGRHVDPRAEGPRNNRERLLVISSVFPL